MPALAGLMLNGRMAVRETEKIKKEGHSKPNNAKAMPVERLCPPNL